MPDMERLMRKLAIDMADVEDRGEVRAYHRGLDRARWETVAIVAALFVIISVYHIAKGLSATQTQVMIQVVATFVLFVVWAVGMRVSATMKWAIFWMLLDVAVATAMGLSIWL